MQSWTVAHFSIASGIRRPLSNAPLRRFILGSDPETLKRPSVSTWGLRNSKASNTKVGIRVCLVLRVAEVPNIDESDCSEGGFFLGGGGGGNDPEAARGAEDDDDDDEGRGGRGVSLDRCSSMRTLRGTPKILMICTNGSGAATGMLTVAVSRTSWEEGGAKLMIRGTHVNWNT